MSVRRPIAAAFVVATLALAGIAAPAHADSSYEVHTWTTGPDTATAGGATIELQIHLLQEDGEFQVDPEVTDIDLVDPAGVARPSLTTVMYQVFTNWYPAPIAGGGPLPAHDQELTRPIHISFAASAPGGMWRLRVQISK